MKAFKKRWFILIICISVAAIGLLAHRFYEDFDSSVRNRYFVAELSEWCAEFTQDNPQLNMEELLSLVYERGGASAHASHFIQFTVILDFWGNPIRHSISKGDLEWRSAGQDGIFFTPDDEASGYREGKVTRLP